MAYYGVLIVASLISLFSRRRRLSLALIIVVLTVFAGTRYRVDNDYDVYEYLFTLGARGRITELNVDPSVWLIPKFFDWLLPTTASAVKASFVAFAALGVTAKVVGISLYSRHFSLSLILYVTNLFLLQEMTTIRAGVASGIFLLAVGPLLRREHWRFFALMAAAFVFHASSILFILVWVLLFFRLRLKYYFAALAISLGMAVLNVNVLSILNIAGLFDRVSVYVATQAGGPDSLNLFSFRVLFALAMLLVLGLRYEVLKEVQWFTELYKLHLLTLIMFFSLSPIASVFSLRTFELMSVVQLLLYPMLLVKLDGKARYSAVAAIVGFSIVQAYYWIEVSGIFRDYNSWLAQP